MQLFIFQPNFGVVAAERLLWSSARSLTFSAEAVLISESLLFSLAVLFVDSLLFSLVIDSLLFSLVVLFVDSLLFSTDSFEAVVFSLQDSLLFSASSRILFAIKHMTDILYCMSASMPCSVACSAATAAFAAQMTQSTQTSGTSPNATIGWMVMQIMAVVVMRPTMAKLLLSVVLRGGVGCIVDGWLGAGVLV